MATDAESKPNQRPMGMIYCDDKTLYIGTEKRKKLYAEIMKNPSISIASYNLHTRKWVRILGEAFEETSNEICNAMKDSFPMIQQKYTSEDENYFTVLGVKTSSIEIE